jgi:sugar/nucleoside kinase (ribokinase family)
MIGSAGELLVEFVCTTQGGRHLRPALYAGPFPSGAPGIFIDQAARMTGRAAFAGAVGDDAFGRVILDRLRASGVDDRLIAVVPGLPTGTAHVAYTPDGSRDFVFNIAQSAAAHLPQPAETEAGFLAMGTRLFHISGSSLGDPALRAGLHDLALRLGRAGVALSVDPNIRGELMRDGGYLETVRALVALADYVLPSDADAALLWPGEAFTDWAGALIGAGARAVALKRGAEGAMAMDADGLRALPARPARVVDPTGAGDCFCATFLARHAAGHGLADALAHATAAGALAVEALGPMEGNAGPGVVAARMGRGGTPSRAGAAPTIS